MSEKHNSVISDVLVTLSAGILVGISVLIMVDGLEWALLSLTGMPKKVIYGIMAVSSVPALFWVAKFTMGAWRSARSAADGI